MPDAAAGWTCQRGCMRVYFQVSHAFILCQISEKDRIQFREHELTEFCAELGEHTKMLKETH